MFHVLLAESAWQHGSKQPPPSVPFLAVEIMPKQITDARAKGGKVHGCIGLIAMAQHWMNEMPQVSWWCFSAIGVLFLVFFNFSFFLKNPWAQHGIFFHPVFLTAMWFRRIGAATKEIRQFLQIARRKAGPWDGPILLQVWRLMPNDANPSTTSRMKELVAHGYCQISNWRQLTSPWIFCFCAFWCSPWMLADGKRCWTYIYITIYN